MNDGGASFTCPEQAQALELATRGESSFFLIGPTGMGKSSVFLIPAKADPEKVTIVIPPLSGLRFDFAMRCKKHQIRCAEWTTASGRGLQSTIVIVSPENVAKAAFTKWAKKRSPPPHRVRQGPHDHDPSRIPGMLRRHRDNRRHR